MKSGELDGLTAQLWNVFAEANAGETRGETRAQGRLSVGLISHGVAENLPDFFLSAAAIPPGTALKPDHHVLIKLPDHKLRHSVLNEITNSFFTESEPSAAARRQENIAPGFSRENARAGTQPV